MHVKYGRRILRSEQNPIMFLYLAGFLLPSTNMSPAVWETKPEKPYMNYENSLISVSK